MSTTIQPRRLAERLCTTIRECRLALDIPAETFAKSIHKSVPFLMQLERAAVSPSYKLVRECARALDLTVRELIEIAIIGHITVLVDEAEYQLRESA
jgi:predicted transcriptional regulator